MKKSNLYAGAAAAAFLLAPSAILANEEKPDDVLAAVAEETAGLTDEAVYIDEEAVPAEEVNLPDASLDTPSEETDSQQEVLPIQPVEADVADEPVSEETTETGGLTDSQADSADQRDADNAAPAETENDVTIKTITANTKVGDGQREAVSFEITIVPEQADLIKDLSAADFDIINNVATTVFDVTQKDDSGNMPFVSPYENDGLRLTVNGNRILLEATPFNWQGTYEGAAWEVICKRYPGLSFSASNIEKENIRTETLDDAIRGTFKYAGIERDYALYLPKNEDGSYAKDVPLVIWNHGGGEFAQDLNNTLVANRGLTAWPEAGYKTAVLEIQVANPNYSYFTAPDSPEWPGNSAAEKEARRKLIDQNNALQAELVRQLIRNGYVNPNQVYVTGASSGGGTTMRFLMQNPDLFAGAIACCSMDPIVWVHFNNNASMDELVSAFEEAFQGTVWTWDAERGGMVEIPVNTEALINVPIYFTHAENDPTCSVRSSQAMYQALKNLGAESNQLRIWTDEEMADSGLGGAVLHWSWVKVFNDQGADDPMPWLFRQSKAAENPDDSEITGPGQTDPVPEDPEDPGLSHPVVSDPAPENPTETAQPAVSSPVSVSKALITDTGSANKAVSVPSKAKTAENTHAWTFGLMAMASALFALLTGRKFRKQR